MSEIQKPIQPENPNDQDSKLSRRKFLIGATAGLGLLGTGAGVGVAVSRRDSESKQPVDSNPPEVKKPVEKSPKPVEQEPDVDPYEVQSWGGIDPELEGEALVEALSIPEDATPEEAAEFFVETDLNYLAMGGATPEEAQKYADLDPYVYMMDEDFKKPLISEMLSKKKAVVDAVYNPDVVDEYIYDTPFRITDSGDSQLFNGLMASSKALYCISYNDPTAGEPYKLQFEAIQTDVMEDGSFSVMVNIINTINKSGDDVAELRPDYIESGLLYDLPERAVVYGQLEKDEASGRYKVGQTTMEITPDPYD